MMRLGPKKTPLAALWKLRTPLLRFSRMAGRLACSKPWATMTPLAAWSGTYRFFRARMRLESPCTCVMERLSVCRFVRARIFLKSPVTCVL